MGLQRGFSQGAPSAGFSFASSPNLIVPRHQGQGSAASFFVWVQLFLFCFFILELGKSEIFLVIMSSKCGKIRGQEAYFLLEGRISLDV